MRQETRKYHEGRKYIILYRRECDGHIKSRTGFEEENLTISAIKRELEKNTGMLKAQDKADAIEEASLKISDEGMAALKKENEAKETKATSERKDSREEQIKEKIAELKKELAELNHPTDEKAKEALKQEENAIMQQSDALTMQLLQIQKHNSESNS
ncbi:MAG: hypothetical protein IJ526_08830 [Lachnospiraceae bacterium]|nr:hypothetical protein [Lachnospiraceae bacterium]